MTLHARTGAPALALAASLLAACSVTPERTAPSPPVAPEPAPALPSPAPPASPATDAHPQAAETHAETASPWPRLRSHFAMNGCDYRPQVMRWARVYARSPRHFAASWDRAMPFLLLVVDEIERRDLPGEFAMLPYVESSYEPIAARGNRPAGMWQLMPDTARSEGLVVTADYDGRLDATASTNAALGLVARYEKEFGDWRLADMAFNSGEYRVRRLLHGRDARSLSAAELGKLAFNPVTHDHLDRLLALSCIVADPQRFSVTLPEPGADDRLKAITLQSGMDVRLAARLAGLDPATMQRFNAAYRRHRMASGVPHELLMPASRIERFQDAARDIPVAFWGDWREQRAARTSGLASWAAEVGIPVAALAAANAIDEGSTVGPSQRLLLPGRESADDDAPAVPSTHVVRAGDTLTSIAHRYHVPLAEIRKLNPAANARTLRPGNRLRIPVSGAN
ncbi:MAG TPA: transglycosylase SLT domain-containing protein [Rhodanobacteraceae bacterium]|nr:transglycosylase SLT domain-containing protein [Rhodanobacteraceae bacterium]